MRAGRKEREMKRLLTVAAGLVIAAAAVTAVVVSGDLTTSSAKAASSGDGLSAYVALTNRGPLLPCSGADCTAANFTWIYVHIINSNPPSDQPVGGGRRATTPNAFVLDSVDETIFVDGLVFSQETLTPPPNVSDRLGTSGRWPATVTCGDPPAPPPCATVLNPAILPGENTVGFYDGWFHGSTEPTGSYVFKFTFHGTLNGAPVDLTASSKSIQMT
jgi:hypothetical protein